MLTIISPAKSFDFDSANPTLISSEPHFTDESFKLIKKMRTFSPKKLGELMNISPELAALNVERYQNWSTKPLSQNTKQAVLAFSGEVYRGLNAKDMSQEDLEFAQNHLRILSGLYGVLRPLDLIQAYRLEMGTKLKINSFNNLYQFWGNKITELINADLDNSNALINLASNEYFKSIKKDQLKAKIITPVFKDLSNGTYKVLMTYAKNARGVMANYIIKNKITEPDLLKSFNENGYIYEPELSDETSWVFTRG